MKSRLLTRYALRMKVTPGLRKVDDLYQLSFVSVFSLTCIFGDVLFLIAEVLKSAVSFTDLYYYTDSIQIFTYLMLMIGTFLL